MLNRMEKDTIKYIRIEEIMKNSGKRKLLACATVILILAFTLILGRVMSRSLIESRQKSVDYILHYYGETIVLQLQGTLNEADVLAQNAQIADDDKALWFNRAAESLLDREEVRFAALFDGDVLVCALPEAEYGSLRGRELKDFSYAYTMAKVVKELVVEGPVIMEFDQARKPVFLFLQPILEGNAYMGEAVIALDADYVVGRLRLDELYGQGYDYELWRVEPQNGNKEVIAVSADSVDFSGAAKITFNLPSQWTLSIQPADGWLNPGQRRGIAVICIMTALLLMTLFYSLFKLFIYRRRKEQQSAIDGQTGLYSRQGFEKALDQWMSKGISVSLYYFVLEEYTRVFQIAGEKEETNFLGSVRQRFKDYIESPFIAGRLGAGNFAVAVYDEMDDIQREDFAKGLSLEILLKVKLYGERKFLTARYQHTYYQPGDAAAAEKTAELVKAYYDRISQESPARMLAEQCRKLIDGQNDINFEEYTDLDMLELSKTFNQYRKQVEQLAYFEPVFNVGNRPKFLRDVNMLISYDKKREFRLFCVDICSFSKYNELFSVDVGDEVLHEVLRRMSRIFGTYLYRINGDVFLGLSQSGEKMQLMAERLEHVLSNPVLIREVSYPLQVRIVSCKYPDHGTTPNELLDRVQSGMRFAKESKQNLVIYNGQMNELLRTESEILHRIESSIKEGSLEVWYQPMMCLETGDYSVVEALVRLSDGRGGFFSAGQVIALAERNGLVECLGDYVLNRACCFMRSYGAGLGLRQMSINLSVQQLLVGNSAEHLLQIIRNAGVEPSKITLEITESILIQSIENASETLKKLRQEGIRIALDDFGVGYSSLNYLSNLPVDVIKIDRLLTQQICDNFKQYALLKSVVEMAGINSITVVAEGVENEAEQKRISQAGVQYIQGYYYARPMDEEKLTAFLKVKKCSLSEAAGLDTESPVL